MSLIQLSTLIQSVASLFPQKMKYFQGYAEEFHGRQENIVIRSQKKLRINIQPEILYDLIPDLSTFSKLWLSLTCFGVNTNFMADEVSTRFLQKLAIIKIQGALLNLNYRSIQLKKVQTAILE